MSGPEAGMALRRLRLVMIVLVAIVSMPVILMAIIAGASHDRKAR